MADDIRLQLLVGDRTVAAPPAEVTQAVTGLRVTTADESASGFQLTLTTSVGSPLVDSLLPTGFFDPPKRLVAAVIWRGTTTVLVDGVVMRHDLRAGDGPGSLTITLTGDDLTALMDLTAKVTDFQGQAVEDQVSSICDGYRQYGIVADVHDAPERDDRPDPRKRSDIQRGTDLAYLRSLAADVGYVFRLDTDRSPGQSTAYWGPARRGGAPQPTLNTNAGGDSNVETLSFSFDGRAKTQYTSKGKVVSAPDVSTLRPPLTARPATALVTAPLPPSARLDATETLLLAGSLAAGASDTVTGTGELDVRRYGAILRSRQLVCVRGAGTSFDGTYYVRSVTHDLAPGRYHESFELVRDGTVPLSQRTPP